MSSPHYTHHQLNHEQYHDKSDAYLNSAVHAEGVEFARMQQLIRQHNIQRLLDIGCGGGHATYQLAGQVRDMMAYDLVTDMVDLVIRESHRRGLTHVSGEVGCAEQLPFADHSFDGIVSRFSAHHWQDVPQALRQMRRVLRPHGLCLIVDIVGHSHPVINNFLQTIETIRDPSHVRDYSLSEWLALTEQAGFTVQSVEKHRIRLDFAQWVARMQTPAHAVHTIHDLQHRASDDVRQYFRIEADGSFSPEVMLLVLTT